MGKAIRSGFGVDLGGNDIKFGATDLSAEQCHVDDLIKLPSLAEQGPDVTIGQICTGLESLLGHLNAAWADVASIAVTVPCPCSPDGAIIESTNLGTDDSKHLWEVPLRDLLAARIEELAGTTIPVFACNDANAAGQDDDFERFGSDLSRRTSVFITTGTGLGGCVLINGKVHHGRGQAGELGHVKPAIPPEYVTRFSHQPFPECGCGAYQCAEATASLTGLKSRVIWALSEEGVKSIGAELQARGETVNPEVVEALRADLKESPKRAAYNVRGYADDDGDAFAKWLLEDWAIMIGLMFASIAPVLHPDHLIIGGGMTELSEEGRNWFIGIVRDVYAEANDQSSFDSDSGNCEIVWSVSKDQGWRGAILMGMRT